MPQALNLHKTMLFRSAGRLLALLALLVLVLPVAAREWTADDVPMVHLQDASRYVCDPDGVMSGTARDTSDYYLGRLHRECGVQTVFVVVNRVKDADCFRMAQDIGNHYGVGTRKERRGLVVVIAVDDRRYFIAPGKGLEADLTDVECDDIARACIVHNMRQNDVDKAVVETCRALFKKLSTGDSGISNGREENSEDTDWFTLIFVLIFCFGSPLWWLVTTVLQHFGLMKPRKRRRKNDDDDWMPPFIYGGGGGFLGGGGAGGGSFGGGSFGGGGAGGGW